MNSFEHLIKEGNWEMKSLGDLATEIYSGNEVTKSQIGTGNYPAVRYCEIHSSNIVIETNSSFVNPDLIKNKKYCEYGDLIITRVSEDIENAGKAAAYLGPKCILGAAVLLIKHNQNPKFLSYVLSTKFARKQVSKVVPKGTIMNFRTSYIYEIKIPVPPRHIQDLIVDQLDQMNNELHLLESATTQLMEKRNKQYEYYRDQLTKN